LAGGVFDFLAQLDHELVEGAGGAVVFNAPDFIEDGVARDGVAAFAPKEGEDFEFARGQFKLVAAAFAAACLSVGAQAQDKSAKKDAPKKAASTKGSQSKMSFFVTSKGSGKGADLGGLKGADALCQDLAKSAGAGNHQWHAYLSANEGGKAINARDRIGKGPWYNAKGEMIAKNVEDLHNNANINKKTALTEKGDTVNGVGDKPNMHDILTGSDSQGRAHPVSSDTTCGNWTKSTDEGSATLGHADRTGLTDNPPAHSWNMAHPSRGCSQKALISSGGNGLLYCFAAR